MNIAKNSHLNPRPNRVAAKNMRQGLPTAVGEFLHTTQPHGPVHQNRWTCNVAKKPAKHANG